MHRRQILIGAAALAGAALQSWTIPGQTRKTRLILLGTGGGPVSDHLFPFFPREKGKQVV